MKVYSGVKSKITRLSDWEAGLPRLFTYLLRYFLVKSRYKRAEDIRRYTDIYEKQFTTKDY